MFLSYFFLSMEKHWKGRNNEEMTVVAERRQASDGARSPKRVEEGVRVCAPKQAQKHRQLFLGGQGRTVWAEKSKQCLMGSVWGCSRGPQKIVNAWEGTRKKMANSMWWSKFDLQAGMNTNCLNWQHLDLFMPLHSCDTFRTPGCIYTDTIDDWVVINRNLQEPSYPSVYKPTLNHHDALMWNAC